MKQSSITAITTAVLCAGILSAAPALAHTGSAEAGLAHPLSGADHVLAMLAVGLWAATLRGRATWLVPAAFLVTMVAGFGFAVAGFTLPAIEPVVLASTVVLGLALAMALRPSPAMAAMLAGTFALFHGQAHGTDGAFGLAGPLEFAAGFAAATALLLAAGVGLGLLGNRVVLPRLLGAAAALAGLGIAALG